MARQVLSVSGHFFQKEYVMILLVICIIGIGYIIGHNIAKAIGV